MGNREQEQPRAARAHALGDRSSAVPGALGVLGGPFPGISASFARGVLFALFALAILTPLAWCGEGPVEAIAEVSRKELYFGEDLVLQISERNVTQPVKPDVTALKEDFVVVEAGDQSLNQSSVMIINGRRIDRSFHGHAYRYKLTPKRSGQVVIPALTMEINGQKVSTRPIALRVKAPDRQDLVLTEIEVTPRTVFPTQPFEVKLRIRVRPLPDQPQSDPVGPLRRRPPRIQINWLDPLPDGLTSTPAQQWLSALQSRNRIGFTINEIGSNDVFAFFERTLALFDLRVGREKRKDLQGREVNYHVYELKRTFVAEAEGPFTFGPANVKGVFVSGVGQRGYDGRDIYAIAEAKSIEVKSVPSPRPASYCGGIGTYQVSAEASPTKLRIGDPLTFTLSFKRGAGAGSLELISAPDLRTFEALAADFDVADEIPTGEIGGERKKFVYTLRPKKVGVSIPALPITFFDPTGERFVDVKTKPIPLDVTEASQLKAGDLVAGTSPVDAKGTALRSRDEGIFQNVTSLAEIGNRQAAPRLYLIASAILLFGYVLLWAGVLVWRRVSSDPAWQRRQAARGNAESALREARSALGEGKNEDALRTLRAALTGLVADMLNLPAAGMTVHEAGAAVRDAGISEAAHHEVDRVLAALDALEYGAKSADELGSALDSAEKLLPVLHKELAQRR